MTTSTTTRTGHLTLTAKADGGASVDCAKCGTGMDVGPTFGPISADDMCAAFIKQHLHTPKRKAKP